MFRLFRGVLLVVIGIVIGIIVLASTLEDADDEPEISTGGGTTTTTAAPDTAPTAIPTQTTAQVDPTIPPDALTTAAPPTIPDPTTLPPGDVKVQVFNGTDTQGAAGSMTKTLDSSNYNTLSPQNAPEGGQYDTSRIYFTTSDYVANAGHVASLLGVTNPGVIQQLPNPSPIAHDGADIIVVIGNDGLAS